MSSFVIVPLECIRQKVYPTTFTFVLGISLPDWFLWAEHAERNCLVLLQFYWFILWIDPSVFFTFADKIERLRDQRQVGSKTMRCDRLTFWKGKTQFRNLQLRKRALTRSIEQDEKREINPFFPPVHFIRTRQLSTDNGNKKNPSLLYAWLPVSARLCFLSVIEGERGPGCREWRLIGRQDGTGERRRGGEREREWFPTNNNK